MSLMKIKNPKYYDLEDYMRDIRDEMENLFRSTFSSSAFMEKELEKGEFIHKPPVQLCEKEGKFELKVQIPGIKKEDINVEVSNDLIKIKAETKEEEKIEEENLFRSEFRYGKYMRTISLPEKVISSDAEAEYKDGILTISAPKAKIETKERKKLTVK